MIIIILLLLLLVVVVLWSETINKIMDWLPVVMHFQCYYSMNRLMHFHCYYSMNRLCHSIKHCAFFLTFNISFKLERYLDDNNKKYTGR